MYVVFQFYPQFFFNIYILITKLHIYLKLFHDIKGDTKGTEHTGQMSTLPKYWLHGNSGPTVPQKAVKHAGLHSPLSSFWKGSSVHHNGALGDN